MIFLNGTNGDNVKVATSGTQVVQVQASWADGLGQTVTPAPLNTSISTGTLTTVVPAPSAGVTRNVKYLSIQNTDAANSASIGVRASTSAGQVPLWAGVLYAGWSVMYIDLSGWWVFDARGHRVQPDTVRPTVVFNGLECFGHSYLDNPFLGPGTNLMTNPSSSSATTTLNSNFLFQDVFAQMIGLGRETVRNHAKFGAQFLQPGCAQGGFARALNEIGAGGRTAHPFVRRGGGYLFCWGANDVGNNSSGTQGSVQSQWQRTMLTIISKARASAIYLAATSSQWAFGTNFSTSPAAAQEYTSGFQTSKQATVVDSGGTTTATFTIPEGYQGEPICFNLCQVAAGTSAVVTWGGTVTGTSGIIGTTTSLSIGNFAGAPCGIRWTAASNGLSAANAGQTITVRLTTTSSQTFVVDGCWIESLKPPPVLWCNMPRLPCRLFVQQFGDGVTTGVNTGLQSASANFLTANDASNSNALTELDAQGAFTPKTVASVTNGTTLVMSGNATGAFTSIKFSLQRLLNGYANGFYSFSNTDFTGATVASHASADADVMNLNAAMQVVASQFDSMVQIVDHDAAIGGDLTVPSNLYSWFAYDGNHPNDEGVQRLAVECLRAALQLQPVSDSQDFYPGEYASSPINYRGPSRRVINSQFRYSSFGATLLPTSVTYTCVGGDIFAIPFEVCDSTMVLTNGTSSAFIEVNAATGAATIRVGLYDDINQVGYPQFLRQDWGTVSTGTTAALVTFASGSVALHPGLYWLVLKVDAVGTAATLRCISGPSPHMPQHSGTAASTIIPIGYKGTGVAAGAFPNTYPIAVTSATLVGASVSGTTACPFIGVFATVSPP